MTQKKISKPTAKALAASMEIGDAEVAVRAYERWMGRGCPISDGTEDWIAARHELEAEQFARAAKAMPRGAATRNKSVQAPSAMH
jgi:hypothetical protein